MTSNRRQFLTIGASAGVAAGLGAFPATAFAQGATTCTLPTSATPVPFTPRTGPNINRKSAFDPTYDYALLAQAYAKMRALPSTDGRSLEGQRNMHAWFCHSCNNVTVPDIHGHWSFLPWHRGFLHFHERILGALVNRPDLRLPYWDWENVPHQVVPPKYYNGSLNDITRFLHPGQTAQRPLGPTTPPGPWYYDLTNTHGLITLTFAQLAGGATAHHPGNVEIGPHGYIHVSTGGYPGTDVGPYVPGDMSNLNTAAFDPVFFAHHSNVDRVWWSWENYGTNKDPQGAFRNQTFSYFDETGKWVSITTADMIPSESKLKSGYDKKILPLLIFRPVYVELAHPKPEDLVTIRQSKAVQVTLNALQFTGTGVFTVRVHTGSRVQTVGSLFVTPHGEAHDDHDNTQTIDANFTVPPAVATAIATAGSTFTIERAAPGRKGTRFLAASPPARAKISGVSIAVPQQ
jgi:Common central domain of tyrosinase